MFIIQRVTLDAERTGKQIIPAMIGGRVRECHVGGLEIIIIQPAISKTDLGFGTIQEWES